MKKNKERTVRWIVAAISTAVALTSLLAVNLYVALPYRTIIYEGDEYVYSLSSSLGLHEKKAAGEAKTVCANISLTDDLRVSYNKPGDYEVNITALGAIPIKTMEVSVIPKASLVPMGISVGVEIETDGVLVISVSDVVAYDGTSFSPAEDAGIKPGDIITKVNDVKINDTKGLTSMISQFGGSAMTFSILRDGEEISLQATPQPDSATGDYKLGLWVRDGTTGIGTMTFYDAESHKYAALGHGISDSDTGTMLNVRDGSLTGAGIVGVQKGMKGTPGELKGYIMTDNVLGNITANNQFGIYGTLSVDITSVMPPMEGADRNEISEGSAILLCCVNGQKADKYQVEIEKVFKTASDTNKSMIVRITDSKLLNATGGIVQGMSGSPIIQNGKIVGAVTHVFVNDPTRGYGIFIENMLDEVMKVK